MNVETAATPTCPCQRVLDLESAVEEVVVLRADWLSKETILVRTIADLEAENRELRRARAK